jgi:ABC-2 type transport system ATP-binding protein
MSVNVKNISKFYHKKKVLDEINFDLKEGEIVGFLGPNGAGKSTLMKIICSYIKQDSGKVLVYGKDNLNEPKKIKKNIGYLSENNPLYENMYVKEFLNFIKNIHESSISNLNNVIKLTDINEVLNKKIETLSKGYRQRVGIAQALIHDPKLIILDEPTSGLDPNQLMKIRNLLLQLSPNKCILFSSHILNEIESLCDRVIIINRGKIIMDKYKSELTSSIEETFKNLINT